MPGRRGPVSGDDGGDIRADTPPLDRAAERTTVGTTPAAATTSPSSTTTSSSAAACRCGADMARPDGTTSWCTKRPRRPQWDEAMAERLYACPLRRERSSVWGRSARVSGPGVSDMGRPVPRPGGPLHRPHRIGRDESSLAGSRGISDGVCGEV